MMAAFWRLLLVSGVALANYTDQQPMARLREVYRSTPGNRADNLDVNIRIMTVLALQQNGWALFSEHWYKLYETELHWLEAESFCRTMAGHLVSILTPAENAFVHRLRKSWSERSVSARLAENDVWIGLNKINDSRQVYKWSDGQSADFIRWDSTQPNEPKVDCAYMAYSLGHEGTWFDYGCWEHQAHYFVCKLPTP